MDIPDTLLAISSRAFMDEAEALRILRARVVSLEKMEPAIMTQASQWVAQIREHGIGHGAEAFLSAYGLDTGEGVALMCLAEALLRIPDSATADALIDGVFAGRDWAAHTGGGDSWLVNVSSWGLLLTGKTVDFGHDAQSGVLHVLKNLAARIGEPVIREALKKAMRLIGSQFVLGETMDEALQQAKSYAKRGYLFSYDILGEGARSDDAVQHYVRAYRDGIAQIAATVTPNTPLFDAPGISVKLSALHARYRLVSKARVMDELLPRLQDIVLQAKAANIAVSIDAEESSRLDIGLLVFERLLADPQLAGWNGVGFVVQAYQKRAFYLIDWLAELARKHRRIIPLRLVKGAYWDSEIKWAQMQGLPSYPVFTRKEYTDISYLACADKILSCREAFYPQFATHNARTIASIMQLAKHREWTARAYEFQRLHGMGEALHDLIAGDVRSRIYAPVGPHKDLLAYLIRRLLENGANSSFVHALMDRSKSAEDILVNPLTAAPHAHALPLPVDMYGTRKNSAGIDFGNVAQLDELQQRMAPYTKQLMHQVAEATPESLDSTAVPTRAAFARWSATNAEARAQCMERAAELIEKHGAELIALMAREAGKTLADGVSEVREAADYCRYYAEAMRLLSPQELRGPAGESNMLSLHPRGVFACISPWNFPLAIFTGQITAALVCGNCVIAKPAEQTPRTAARAVALLHEAGIPKDVLQLVPGAGETIGAALVRHATIDGVVFTGSVEAAKSIHASLAARSGPIIPLIAETGGQNCMVVDSSALPEQAVDDIIVSAFGSAGQRCSCLRVLFVQEDIADGLLGLLAGAMQKLQVGDPLDPATDIGPVIDAQAQKALLEHIGRMKKSAKLIASSPHPNPLPEGEGAFFVAPHAFEIAHISELKGEVFGPVLHVIRFASGTLPQVIEAINSTGYGLTFGVHSRIESHIQLLVSNVRAGNIYVNRGMTGAVVGVQPFGGEGLSGTGPKAGGPHYLMHFMLERAVSVNTAAIGGNIELLSSE